ncbi:hypothetical protein E1B28_001154 [Marasmius oreades]|uniref:Uncharacterized protein n=1 Tax=Marasmius oreades TaxID=181124 RepID=A0A9P8AEW1_9AGAR|nr:uncharacterized protein E1B28_001154 [Marasmius oreades]KAG7099296.1 hypothetical protein E1B28_001154 [Marasmius oreades]
MKPREYCCCAIPVINAGIYATMIEQFLAGILVGILSISTPHIVGSAMPSFAALVLAIVCFVMAGLQVLAVIGVAREKPTLFRRYLTLHSIAMFGAFAVAAAWIIISATKHSTAKSRCLSDFFSNPDTESQGDTLCEIFSWVSVGVMGGLWAVLAIMHVYLYVVLVTYSSEQQKDHIRYNALNDSTNENIPMNDRNDWDTRPSQEYMEGEYAHGRQGSAASVADIINQPTHNPEDGFSKTYSRPYPPERQVSSGSAFHPPTIAYTQDPGPTPKFNDAYYIGNPTAGVGRPAQAQPHPAEGSFGRKTPRYDPRYQYSY